MGEIQFPGGYQYGHQWRGLSSSGSGDWKCANCGLYVNGGIQDGGPYFPGRGQVVRPCIPECPECGETLCSHANRNWKYFHRHVVDGPYPNPKPHACSLVNIAFEHDGSPIRCSDVVRFGWAETIHRNFNRRDYPNQPNENHGLSDDELGDVFLETHYPGGKKMRHSKET